MAEFAAEVYQNEFLSEGATDVHAIVTVTCRGAGSAGSAGGAGGVAEIIMVDTSGSMSGRNIEAAKHAAQVAVDQILDGTWFAIVGGSHVAAAHILAAAQQALRRRRVFQRFRQPEGAVYGVGEVLPAPGAALAQ